MPFHTAQGGCGDLCPAVDHTPGVRASVFPADAPTPASRADAGLLLVCLPKGGAAPAAAVTALHFDGGRDAPTCSRVHGSAPQRYPSGRGEFSYTNPTFLEMSAFSLSSAEKSAVPNCQWACCSVSLTQQRQRLAPFCPRNPSTGAGNKSSRREAKRGEGQVGGCAGRWAGWQGSTQMPRATRRVMKPTASGPPLSPRRRQSRPPRGSGSQMVCTMITG